ncbi:hypothetical protein [Pseudooceanicola nanhaiensis]|uniref:hypothetical protein n=1 Tax=Pseudooceanicola nanhaiensis TaxID=375761 RepID=UPI00300A2453
MARWRFANRSEVETFLVREFPEFDPVEVLSAFSWAFFEGSYQPTDSKKVWAKEVAALRRIERLKRENGEEPDDDADLIEIWHKSMPMTGGRDPADYVLADWVKMGFEDLGCPITYGVSSTSGVSNAPSTRFGRVVEAALDYRRSAANWRRPAEAAAKCRGPLW